jgi:hypothetical protein
MPKTSKHWPTAARSVARHNELVGGAVIAAGIDDVLKIWLNVPAVELVKSFRSGSIAAILWSWIPTRFQSLY